MKKKPKKITPDWLDEDPDEEARRAKDSSDLYGDMTDISRFHDSKVIDHPIQQPEKPQTKQSIAAFCGRWGMRLQGELAVLDLHGMRHAAAIDAVDRAIQAILDDGRVKKIRIITGKGNHSEGIGVLAKEIHPHVKNTYFKSIDSIDVSPGEFVVAGHPAKGHFDIRFR